MSDNRLIGLSVHWLVHWSLGLSCCASFCQNLSQSPYCPCPPIRNWCCCVYLNWYHFFYWKRVPSYRPSHYKSPSWRCHAWIPRKKMVLPSCQLTNEPYEAASRELLEGGRNEPNDVVMEPPSLHGGEGGGGTGIKMGRNSICFQCDSAEKQDSPTKKLKSACSQYNQSICQSWLRLSSNVTSMRQQPIYLKKIVFKGDFRRLFSGPLKSYVLLVQNDDHYKFASQL